MTSAATDKSKRATNAVGVCIALICIGLLAYALVDCGPGETLRLVKTSGRKADAPYWDRQVTAVASNRFSMHPGSTGPAKLVLALNGRYDNLSIVRFVDYSGEAKGDRGRVELCVQGDGSELYRSVVDHKNREEDKKAVFSLCGFIY